MENKREKKTNVALIVIVTLIIGVAIGIGGVYAYNKILKDDKTEDNANKTSDKKDKEEKEEKPKIEKIDINNKLVKDNFGKLMKAAGHYAGAQSEYFTEKKLNNIDIPNYLVFATISASGLMKDKMTETEFEELVKQFFGEDYNYKHEEISGKMCAAYYYDSNDKKYYESRPGGCGGAAGPNIMMYTMTDAELEKDELRIYFKVIFPGKYDELNDKGNIKYYKDANHTEELTNLEYSTEEYQNGAPLNTESNIKQGATYKVTMKKYKDDIYSFVSSEPLK